MLQRKGYEEIKFADFDVYNAWKLFKYNVRRDFIIEAETLMGTHHVKEVGCNTFGRLSRL